MKINQLFTSFQLNFLYKILVPVLQIQFIPALGYLFSLLVSYFYFFINDKRYPQEHPLVLWFGVLSSLCLYFLGYYILKKNHFKKSDVNLKDGALIVILSWLVSCTISSIVFVLAGFPEPNISGRYSLMRQFTDAFFESMSGYTTTGATILPLIEVYPRGVLMWREVTHWIGGMGIAYLAITILNKFAVKKGNIINSEAETPNIVEFKNDKEAETSGWDFLKIYSLLTVILLLLLLVSGAFFRVNPYEKWYDNVYDSVLHTFGTMGTGGFSSYNTSVGLPTSSPENVNIVGGLQNHISEWIIAFFMFVSGGNFSLWYILFFKVKSWREVFHNLELRVYTLIVFGLSGLIGCVVYFSGTHSNFVDSLRYAFFNVTTIISTTGYGNFDFTRWPALAQGLLFITFITGGMVGSTAGGVKILRYNILSKLTFMELKNLLTGKKVDSFKLDGVIYNLRSAGLVVVNIVIYLMLFLFGGVLIMASSPKVHLYDGKTANIDFASAYTASLSTLGNIGPAAAVGSVDAGPNGNYYAYSEISKIIMIVLMFVGRLGVLTFLLLFITHKGEYSVEDSITEIKFDTESPVLKV